MGTKTLLLLRPYITCLASRAGVVTERGSIDGKDRYCIGTGMVGFLEIRVLKVAFLLVLG